jgi:hypothetical protein
LRGFGARDGRDPIQAVSSDFAAAHETKNAVQCAPLVA